MNLEWPGWLCIGLDEQEIIENFILSREDSERHTYSTGKKNRMTISGDWDSPVKSKE